MEILDLLKINGKDKLTEKLQRFTHTKLKIDHLNIVSSHECLRSNTSIVLRFELLGSLNGEVYQNKEGINNLNVMAQPLIGKDFCLPYKKFRDLAKKMYRLFLLYYYLDNHKSEDKFNPFTDLDILKISPSQCRICLTQSSYLIDLHCDSRICQDCYYSFLQPIDSEFCPICEYGDSTQIIYNIENRETREYESQWEVVGTLWIMEEISQLEIDISAIIQKYSFEDDFVLV